jgi:hypothetical protein
MILLQKKYDGESCVDVGRDVSEAFVVDFTPQLSAIPHDEYGFAKGTFTVTIEWSPHE